MAPKSPQKNLTRMRICVLFYPSFPRHYHMIIFALCLLLSSAEGVSFIPKRTPIRDRIFLGLKEEAPVVAGTGAIVVLPPASSIQGVNATALANSDLHEYGSMGVPADVLAARELEAANDGTEINTPVPKSFLTQSTSSTTSVRHALDFFSVIWLIVILVACVFFIGAALREANKKQTIGKKPAGNAPAKRVVRPVSVADKRIDREAYVYVDGG